MKLLLDENLSRRLVARLTDLSFQTPVMLRFTDCFKHRIIAVWECAKSNDFSIVTADADFYELAITLGSPPKVIWLRGCDYPTSVAERLIRDQAIRITEFLKDPERTVLVLKP